MPSKGTAKRYVDALSSSRSAAIRVPSRSTTNGAGALMRPPSDSSRGTISDLLRSASRSPAAASVALVIQVLHPAPSVVLGPNR